jgi:hypothetical protein
MVIVIYEHKEKRKESGELGTTTRERIASRNEKIVCCWSLRDTTGLKEEIYQLREQLGYL